jgi:hypothetical protein
MLKVIHEQALSLDIAVLIHAFSSISILSQDYHRDVFQ